MARKRGAVVGATAQAQGDLYGVDALISTQNSTRLMQ